MGRNHWVRSILLVVSVACALVLVSCGAALEESAGPKAWIGAPKQGTEVPPGQVPVMCHAFARGGVAQVELFVNGAFSSRLVNTTNPGASYFNASLSFEAGAPGLYVLLCRALDQAGAAGQSEPVRIEVGGEAPTATPREAVPPTSTPTQTERPPTVTPTTTGTPTPTPTSTPTARARPTISFEADPSLIVQGQCSTLSWDVEGATEVYLNGQGVVGHGTRPECPPQTTAYTLLVQSLVGDITTVVTIDLDDPTAQFASTAITADAAFRSRLVDCTHIDRLNLGPIPTTKLDWLQPHEGNIIDFLYRSRALQVSQPAAVGA